MELLEKLFLGVGSSGLRPQPRPRFRSTTYFTWSQSAQRPSRQLYAGLQSVASGLGDNKIAPKQSKTNTHGPSKPDQDRPLMISRHRHTKSKRGTTNETGYPHTRRTRHDAQQTRSGERLHRANPESTRNRCQIELPPALECDIQRRLEERFTDPQFNPKRDHPKDMERGT